MEKKILVYSVCTDDEFQLPCGVFSNLRDVALFLGCAVSTALVHLMYSKPIKGFLIFSVLVDC